MHNNRADLPQMDSDLAEYFARQDAMPEQAEAWFEQEMADLICLMIERQENEQG